MSGNRPRMSMPKNLWGPAVGIRRSFSDGGLSSVALLMTESQPALYMRHEAYVVSKLCIAAYEKSILSLMTSEGSVMLHVHTPASNDTATTFCTEPSIFVSSQ